MLPNGLTVISSDDHGPVSSVTAFVRAGTRYETAATIGTTQFTQTMAFQDTVNRTGLWIKRETENLGISTGTSYDREYITYNATSLRHEMPRAVDNLADAVTGPLFNGWEVSEAQKRVHMQVHCASTSARVSDVVHKTAFRRGLGNPVVMADYQVGNVTTDALRHHVATLYSGDRIVIVGSGVNHDDLLHMFRKDIHGLPASGAPVSVPGVYHGGEAYVETDTDMTTVVLAHQGAAATSANQASLKVLQALLGGATRIVKYAPSSSPVHSAVAGTAGASAYAFNDAYTDAGLFGVSVSAPAASISEAIKRTNEMLNKVLTGGFSAQDVERAKKQVKGHVLDTTRSQRDHAVGVLGQTPEDLAALVDNVTQASVTQVWRIWACR